MSEQGLRDNLRWARSFGPSLVDTMPALLPSHVPLAQAESASMVDLVIGVDHVGFIAAEPVETVRRVARELGLWADAEVVTSSAIAAELAALSGRDTVETGILELSVASSEAPPAQPGIEVFVPHGVEVEVVDRWVADGRGRHVALAVRSATHEAYAAALLEWWGYRRPRFLDEMGSAGEPQRVLYFDHPSPTTVRRVELCRRP
jgi:hypothetical protein